MSSLLSAGHKSHKSPEEIENDHIDHVLIEMFLTSGYELMGLLRLPDDKAAALFQTQKDYPSIQIACGDLQRLSKLTGAKARDTRLKMPLRNKYANLKFMFSCAEDFVLVELHSKCVGVPVETLSLTVGNRCTEEEQRLQQGLEIAYPHLSWPEHIVAERYGLRL